MKHDREYQTAASDWTVLSPDLAMKTEDTINLHHFGTAVPCQWSKALSPIDIVLKS